MILEEKERPGKGRNSRMTILVVDDDKLARKGLIAIMNWEKYGFEVVGDVPNGRKALEFLKEHPVDIVFTDIDMPEIDGIQLMQICKKTYPSVKFVIFSVYEDFRYAQTAIRLGALDYLSKISFDPDECEQILEQISTNYRKICGQEQIQEENKEVLKELEKCWMHPKWIFNDREFEVLCVRTQSIGLRWAERIFIKCFHNFQIIMGEETNEFPSLDTVEEMLEWIKNWRKKIYETCANAQVRNDICSFVEIILYVEEHVDDNLRSEEAASRIGMSRSYFSTRFKEMTGETFHNYVISRKMNAAARRIRDGSKNITQIAAGLGYDNFHYFAKVFAKEYGCTPAEYRNKIKNV